jgi:hypothetical protein
MIGAIGGTVTGLIIYYLRSRLGSRPYFPGWVLGLLTCSVIWAVLGLIIGLPFLSGDTPEAEIAFLTLYLYPGIIYIMAGTLFSNFVVHDGP